MDVNGKEDVFQLGSISVSHVPAALINMNCHHISDLGRLHRQSLDLNPAQAKSMSLHIPLFCWYMLQIMLLSSIPKGCQRRACPNFYCFTPREKGCFRDMIFIDFPSRFGETDKLLSVNVEVYIFFFLFSYIFISYISRENNIEQPHGFQHCSPEVGQDALRFVRGPCAPSRRSSQLWGSHAAF